jgi:hypothetical protein
MEALYLVKTKPGTFPCEYTICVQRNDLFISKLANGEEYPVNNDVIEDYISIDRIQECIKQVEEIEDTPYIAEKLDLL